ncbi:hypothetical protein [Kushneria indalinina]|uniref:Uncharacterized protein n=1 Tax=Kushneria indalinina DSM 14324 TaxID=1122140 RepID=A0A3D9DYV6_9GAMM|nr:hypothetical protein [Kushneria indalinina]REC95891.1 hypothetical protein C8D72_0559 [Kushneria indalinina DSM 14324]
MTLRLRRSCQTSMAWMAHQLVTWRISPAGLALTAIVLAVATAPLLYAQQCLMAALAVLLYRLMSVLSGWVSRALGHLDARQRYLRPFMEIVLIVSVMAGLSLYSPERLFWPALTLVIVLLVFDLERRLVVLLQEVQSIVTRTGAPERIINIVTGSVGRTLLLMAACYWPQSFFWSGFAFAGLCLGILAWRLVTNYRQLGMAPEMSASGAPTEQTDPDSSI